MQQINHIKRSQLRLKLCIQKETNIKTQTKSISMSTLYPYPNSHYLNSRCMEQKQPFNSHPKSTPMFSCILNNLSSPSNMGQSALPVFGFSHRFYPDVAPTRQIPAPSHISRQAQPTPHRRTRLPSSTACPSYTTSVLLAVPSRIQMIASSDRCQREARLMKIVGPYCLCGVFRIQGVQIQGNCY